mmetsp:Transcript_20213/g.35931  ORF Transcript_20213/g.35931 Transcript_20213/m.35931 type:complete len:205 (-) Transcript_20213:1063-1677(-)
MFLFLYIFTHLHLVYKCKGVLQALEYQTVVHLWGSSLFSLSFGSHKSLREGMRCETGIPQHGAIVALHLQSILREPKVVQDTRKMVCEGRRVRPKFCKSRYDVKRFVDRANVNPVCVLIFHVNAFKGKVIRPATKPRERPMEKRPYDWVFDGMVQKGVCDRHKLALAIVYVNLRHVFPYVKSVPSDIFVLFHIEFLSQLCDQGI